MKKKTYVAPVVTQVDFMVEGGFTVSNPLFEVTTQADSDQGIQGANWYSDEEFNSGNYFSN